MAIHDLVMYGLDCFTPTGGSTSLGEFAEGGPTLLDIGDQFIFDTGPGHVYAVQYEDNDDPDTHPDDDPDKHLNEGGLQFLLNDVTLHSPYAPRLGGSDPTVLTPGPEGLTMPAGNRIGGLYRATFSGSDGETYTLAGVTLDFDDKSPIHQAVETTHVVYWIGAVPPDGTTLTVTGTENNTGGSPVCFVAGTRILTPSGPVPVETLRAGDPVITLDHGARTVRWAGGWRCSAAQMARNPGAVPIRFEAGALGNGFPAPPLLVSRQHRVMVASPIVQRMFGVPRCLVPALAFLEAGGAAFAPQAEGVRYHHLLLDRHAVILANGLPSETLWLGPNALAMLSPGNRAEIAALGATFRAAHIAAGPALTIPRNRACKRLVRRHIDNARAFLPPNLCPPVAAATAACG